jgi:beta-glucosidase
VLITSTTDTPSAGASAAASAATALVFISSDSGEGYITVEGNAGDRNNLDPWHHGNGLVAAVAAVNKKTIVVIYCVGPLILESILALPSVVAVVWAGIPGQESGNGLVDILYGSTSPSGKLPFTIAKVATDYGTSVVPADDSYPEGLFIDYQHFDKSAITPRYEFGFGLSYTYLFRRSAQHHQARVSRPEVSNLFMISLLLSQLRLLITAPLEGRKPRSFI